MERPDDRAADAATAREAEPLEHDARRGTSARRAGRAASTTKRVGTSLQRVLAVAAGFLLLAGAVALVADFVSSAGGDGGTTVRLISARGTRAKGEAKVRRTPQGSAVELKVEGLPRTRAGFHYECWFVGDGDTPAKPNRVSAGTFEVPDSRAHTVEMSSAANAARFPKVGVTVEPDDGNPQPTEDKALVSVP